MSDCLCLSIQLLDPCFHGLRDRNRLLPEWPPAPSRAYQSLVAAAAARTRGKPLAEPVRLALEWLEQQPEPMVLAPRSIETDSYRTSVPHNEMDIVARAWSRGNYSNTGDANPATHKTMKSVKRTHLLQGGAIHYLWPLPDPLTEALQRHARTLSELARSVVALGWGIDMAVGQCAILSPDQIERLPGERWLPTGEAATDGLRVPGRGQLANLIHRHERFLERPRPLPYPCRTVAYRRSFDPAPRPNVTFTLRDPDRDTMRPFDPVRHTVSVARMARCALKRVAGGARPTPEIDRIVMGHGEARGDEHDPVESPRVAYLPLPSLEYRSRGKPHVIGSIRRVMLATFEGGSRDEAGAKERRAAHAMINWARNYLPGQELLDPHRDHAAVALLSPPTPKSDPVTRCYLDWAASWATVTPVVLPGYDDPRHLRRRLQQGVKSAEQHELLERLGARIDALLRKAITQAGFPPALAERAELDWRASGFWPGADLASHYTVPDYLERFPRLHVRITWRDPAGRPLKLPGPICFGGGRFFGLGLFASDRDA